MKPRDAVFVWDRANVEHTARHGITPEKAEQVIGNDPLDIPPPQIRKGEQRFVHLGETDAGRILFVIVAKRDFKLRVVTAFPAKLKWRRFYKEQKEGGDDEDL